MSWYDVKFHLICTKQIIITAHYLTKIGLVQFVNFLAAVGQFAQESFSNRTLTFEDKKSWDACT